MKHKLLYKFSRLLLAVCLAVIPAFLWGQNATTWADKADINWYTSHENDNDYTLTSAEQLAGLAKLVNEGTDFSSKNIKLNNDIDLGNYLWISIGKEKKFQPLLFHLRGALTGKDIGSII